MRRDGLIAVGVFWAIIGSLVGIGLALNAWPWIAPYLGAVGLAAIAITVSVSLYYAVA